MFAPIHKEYNMEKIRNKDGRTVSYREKVYVNGKAVTKTFKRKSDASNWKKNIHAESQRKEALGIGHVKSVGFETFTVEWMEMKGHQGLARKTLEEYGRTIARDFIPILKNLPLEKITEAHGRKIIKKIVMRGLCAKTVNDIMAILKQILNDAIKLDYLFRSPLMGIKKAKVKPRSLSYWMPEEIKQFLTANRYDPLYPLFVVALNTGMRRGELVGLCWDKVNLAERRIEIARIVDRYGLKDTTKTGSIRHIPLNGSALKALEELSRNRAHERFVFSHRDGSLIDANHLSDRQFKRAMARAGVRRIRFHDLRATYASNFVMAGGDIFALSKLLGHTSVEMTAKKYAALHPSFMKGAVETVGFCGGD